LTINTLSILRIAPLILPSFKFSTFALIVINKQQKSNKNKFMFPTVNPTSTEAWKELEAYFKAFEGTQMKALFSRDPERFAKYSIKFEDILVDFSKNIVDDHTFKLLMLLARECGLKDAITSQFTGERINKTENRPVLHT
jgi:glucose-6-phosphate isomerase